MVDSQSPNPPALAVAGPVFCVNHPTVETGLRCNKCGNPICAKCARRTPVGFRCPQCVQNQQAAFFTATAVDYAVAGAVGLVISIVAGFLMAALGWFFAIFLGPLIGGGIGEAMFRLSGRRRGRWMPWLAVVVVVVGGAVIPLLPLILDLSLLAPALNRPETWRMIGTSAFRSFNIVFVVLASIAVYARLRF